MSTEVAVGRALVWVNWIWLARVLVLFFFSLLPYKHSISTINFVEQHLGLFGLWATFGYAVGPS